MSCRPDQRFTNHNWQRLYYMETSLPEDFVNSLRLQTFLDLLGEKVGHGDLQLALAALRSEDAVLCRSLPAQLWINVSQEERIIAKLCQDPGMWAQVEKCGLETFSSHMAQIIPALPAQSVESSAIAYLPGILSLIKSSYRLALKQEGNAANLHFIENCSGVIDALFILGFTRGFFSFLKQDSAICSVKSLPFAASAWPLAPDGIAFEKPGLISIGGLKLEKQDAGRVRSSLGWSMPAREAFVKQVVARSSKLIRDKRELSTAVEYLNVANEELDREIQENRKELNMARNIQKGFIPAVIPDWQGLQFWVHYAPLREVSGDIYDFIEMDSKRASLFVGDVSGHGVPAALISAIAKISFHTHRHENPAAVFSNVNLDMINFVKMEGYLTAVYLALNSDFSLSYSLAGIPPPFLYRYSTDEVVRLQGGGTLLGMFPNASEYFSDEHLQLKPGDKVFIFTDGLTEAFNRDGEQFGDERLRRAIAPTRDMNAEEACNHLVETYRQFILGESAHDDLTLVVLAASPHKDEYDALCFEYQAHRKKGDLIKARLALSQAVAIFPRDPARLFELGKLLSELKEYKEAIAILTRHNELKGNFADAWTVLGYCHFRLGQVDKARNFLRRSLSIRRNNPSALYHLYKVLVRQGRQSEASEILLELKYLAPENSRVRNLHLVRPQG